jgi:hypothetical protein
MHQAKKKAFYCEKQGQSINCVTECRSHHQQDFLGIAHITDI